MKKLPPEIRSTAQLAEHLGLSRWTVSRVLNGHTDVGEETRQRVLQAISQSEFTPNLFARGLRGGRTGLVGVCLQEFENLHLAGKLAAFQERLGARGLRMLIATNDGKRKIEEETIRQFIAMRVEAIAMIASLQDAKSSALAELTRSGIPHILIDPIHAPLPYSVSVDRADAMLQAVAHLKEQGRSQLFAAGIHPFGPYGAKRAEALGTEVKLIYEPDAPRMDFEYGHRLGVTLAKRKWKNAGIIALNDRVALGLIRALLDHGREVPTEVSVIGYDNMSMGAFFRPSLTTLDPESDHLIATASDLLCQWIASGSPPNEAPIQLRTRLILRESA